jgi:hypothetical protein
MHHVSLSPQKRFWRPQGLKIFEGKDVPGKEKKEIGVDLGKFKIDNLKGLKRTARSFGNVSDLSQQVLNTIVGISFLLTKYFSSYSVLAMSLKGVSFLTVITILKTTLVIKFTSQLTSTS